MEILNKWKVFAIEQVFSHDSTEEEAITLFDGLCNCGSDKESVLLLNSLKAIPWHVFENKPLQWIVDQMTCLAEDAQSISESFMPKQDMYIVVNGGCVQYVSSTNIDMNITVIDIDDMKAMNPADPDNLFAESNLATAESLARVW